MGESGTLCKGLRWEKRRAKLFKRSSQTPALPPFPIPQREAEKCQALVCLQETIIKTESSRGTLRL